MALKLNMELTYTGRQTVQETDKNMTESDSIILMLLKLHKDFTLTWWSKRLFYLNVLCLYIEFSHEMIIRLMVVKTV